MTGTLVAVALAAAMQVGAQQAKTEAKVEAKAETKSAFASTKDKVSYAIGVVTATNFKTQGIDVNPEMIGKGLTDAMAGKALMTEAEVRETLTAFTNDMRAKAQAQMQETAEKNKTAGESFLAANKSKPGVVTLPSGLQYKVIKEGTGKKPSGTDTVSVNYKGTLIDGTEFDSSYKRGEPATFPVNGVIAGWTEALKLMPVGSKWELFIPSGLAYGQQGAGGGAIGPNAALVFEVELLSIKGDQPAAK